MRTGLIAQKIGMTQYFTDSGKQLPVTVLKIDGCHVLAQRTDARDGYTAVQLGVGTIREKLVTKPLRGHFAKAKILPRRKIAEFRVSPENMIDIGAEIMPDHFIEGQRVDAIGTSIGKGFAGAMKRHNFSGLRASHGVSVSHRSHGSTGQCQDPGRVFKGKKMAGHMGDVRVTMQNLTIVATDNTRGLILVKGAVPGAKGGWVLLRDAIKHKLPDNVPSPGSIRTTAGTSEQKDISLAGDEAPTGETSVVDKKISVATEGTLPASSKADEA